MQAAAAHRHAGARLAAAAQRDPTPPHRQLGAAAFGGPASRGKQNRTTCLGDFEVTLLAFLRLSKELPWVYMLLGQGLEVWTVEQTVVGGWRLRSLFEHAFDACAFRAHWCDPGNVTQCSRWYWEDWLVARVTCHKLGLHPSAAFGRSKAWNKNNSNTPQLPP